MYCTFVRKLVIPGQVKFMRTPRSFMPEHSAHGNPSDQQVCQIRNKVYQAINEECLETASLMFCFRKLFLVGCDGSWYTGSTSVA